MEQLVFSWIDYLLSISLLGLSLFIGCYFGFCSKQNSVDEYLFGGKRMSYLPVSISIVASCLSGITFLGVPTEVYLHGAQYFLMTFSTIANGLVTAYIFIPVFYKLQVASTFEYLELRFSKGARSFASALYIFSLLVYVPVVIYVPSLAFSHVTGFNLHVIALVICIICITYTTMGGVKAVVWTDAIQFIFTIVGLITFLVIGTKAAGGFSKIWTVSEAGQRLDIFDFNLSPFVRNTFWSMTIGSSFSTISNSALGQKFVQRYLSIGDQKDIRKAVLLKTVGIICIDTSVIFTGLVIYTHYHDCDPIRANVVARDDQVVPLYVLEITKNLPGISGLFLVGIVSSALSTMSASINTLSGIIYDDFIDRWVPEGPNKDSTAAYIMKAISVCTGGISIGLVFVIEHLGTVLEISYSLRGAVDGPLLGIFLLGILCPWVGKKGAITGGYTSLLVMIWIVMGSKWHMINKRIRYSHLPTSIDNCPDFFNATLVENVTLPPLSIDEEPLKIFQLSFLYFTLLGTMITIIVGFITSILIGESNISEVDPDHINAMLQRILPKKKYKEVSMNEIAPGEKTLEGCQ